MATYIDASWFGPCIDAYGVTHVYDGHTRPLGVWGTPTRYLPSGEYEDELYAGWIPPLHASDVFGSLVQLKRSLEAGVGSLGTIRFIHDCTISDPLAGQLHLGDDGLPAPGGRFHYTGEVWVVANPVVYRPQVYPNVEYAL